MQTAKDNAELSLRYCLTPNAEDKKQRALSVIKKEEGEAVPIAIIVKALESVANYYNVGKNLDKTQIIDVAVLTAKEWYFLTENQIQLFVNRIKLNKYAEQVKVLDSFDGRIWFACLELFQKELIAERKKLEVEERQRKYEEWERQREADPPKPETIQKAKALGFRIFLPNPEIYQKYVSEQEAEQKRIFEDIKAEFEEMFPKEGKRAGGIRFILYKDVMLNFEAYAKQRFEEMFNNQNQEE